MFNFPTENNDDGLQSLMVALQQILSEGGEEDQEQSFDEDYNDDESSDDFDFYFLSQILKGQGRSQQQMEDPFSRKSFGQGSNFIGSANASNSNIIEQAKQAIMNAYPDNPVLQKVALTQAFLESGLGSRPSKLAMQHKNLFGIKSSRSAPGSAHNVNMATDEYGAGGRYRENAGFSSNATFDDSAMQHRHLLQNKRYGNVREAESPLEAFIELQRAGYATDPDYARKLSSIFKRNVEPLY